MIKKIQKVLINIDEIEVFSNINGVNNITQLSIEPNEDEIEGIFQKFNLSDLIHYPFDMRIVRALVDNEEQLKDYLEACRRAKFSNGKSIAPESVPTIEYDLRELKKCEYDMAKKIDIYNQAKETKKLFKCSKGKIIIKMSIIDKAYMEVQSLLLSSVSQKVLALNAGVIATEKKKC